jgi:putative transposase
VLASAVYLRLVPRRSPIDPAGYYHVSTRGNFGMPLFTTPAEHELYLSLFERVAREFQWNTLAWSLIWNHHHFVIKLTDGGLSEGMRRVNHGFARRINAVYRRTGKGHLVRHCFYAGEIETDEQLANVCRYVDLNAVAAGQCRLPEHWPWCGYAATIGLVPPRRFHDVRAALTHFGSRPGRARDAYRRFVERGLESPPTPPSPGRVTKASRQMRPSVVRSQP